jgi:hypothetical protein
VSRGVTAKYVKKLEEAGYIQRDKKVTRRNIELVESKDLLECEFNLRPLSEFDRSLTRGAVMLVKKIVVDDDQHYLMPALALLEAYLKNGERHGHQSKRIL